MKILLIQDYLRCGGTERQTVSLCEQFARSRHDVHLLTFRPGGELAGWVGCAGIPSHALQPFDSGLNFFAPGLSREVARLSPDVIMCMGRVANSYAGFLRERFRNIVTVGSARTGKPLPLLNQWSFRRVDAVIANCEWWRRKLVASGVPRSKVKVIHSGLSISWEGRVRSSVREEVRTALGATPTTVVFLNVAGFRRGKRHAWLIETITRMHPGLDWQLWLVGDGAERTRCHRMVKRANVGRRIKILGHHRDPYRYFEGADVAVSASVEDSLPNFLLEAQSMGLPVIATDVRGVRETFSHGKTGYLVRSDDRGDFLSCLEELYSDDATRRSMGELARRFAEQHFSRQRQADKILCVFEDLAGA